MKKEIIADVNHHEARVALLEDGELVEIQVEYRGQERLVGNIYKGKVCNVLPGMQAAFVDVGLERNAFLYAGDILADKSDFEFQDNKNDNVEGKLKEKNIKDMVKQGQEIMVQVLKQQGGTKGARVTTHITLPGRMMVLMPTVDHVGVSRKIDDEAERERLKDLFTQIKPEGMGVIVRTVAEGGSEEEFRSEMNFLTRLWEKIRQKADFFSAPRLIHSEESLLFRTVRDMFNADVERFIIKDKDYYEKVLAVVEITMPSLIDKVEYFSKPDNIFDYYGVENKIEKAMQRKVWLDNGAYLVIDETEALTVIDVNTGKYIGEDDFQDTIVTANIEAAKEIARQLRLRDIGGIVVIDFIDMESEANKQKVVEALEEALKKDRTKPTVLGITDLGLVEMTRKKQRRRLSALLQSTCPHCGGKGKVYSDQTMAMRVRREVARLVLNTDADKFLVEVAPSVARYIVDKNNHNIAILPQYEGKSFYISENKLLHNHDIKVTPLNGGNMRQVERAWKDAEIFC
ncbi:MAG: Rne/Rng family ribonuclease [Christensenellaceae bacterium]|nr:Rne/Rng family ribonuclease [Christensenellaceae bacterium]